MLNRCLRIWKKVSLKILQPILSIWEDYFFTYDSKTIPQPVFIIGAPRTGSTILYQALTNAYQFAYIDNTACFWHQNLRFGFWLSTRKYSGTPHNNFQAEYGSTNEYGGHAPSECGSFWYRWLPRNRHFIDHDEISAKAIRELRKEVLGVSAYSNQPLLFKNLNAGQRLRFIKKAFPEAKFIFVRRDPRFVTRSILKGRNKVAIREGKWWGIMPPNFMHLISLPEKEMCVAQVFYIEKQIEEDLRLFPGHNIKVIHYQEFSEQSISELTRWVGVDDRSGGSLPKFKKDIRSDLETPELKELNLLMQKYPFRQELFI